jgi:hypothetical protein
MSELYNLINNIADNKLVVLLFSGLLGFSLNVILTFAGFNWLKTLNQRLIYLIFPVSMTVISWTISGNLGLSLGMIGALSIVRFRTPVKSPIELIFYFVLIVIGISITVAPVYTFLLFGVVSCAPFIFKFIFKFTDGDFEFSQNENELSKLSIANFNIESNTSNITDDLKLIYSNLLEIKEDENKNCNLSFEVTDLTEYQSIKKQLAKCGKIKSSDFIS